MFLIVSIKSSAESERSALRSSGRGSHTVRKEAPLTQPSALACVDLPQLDAFLQARGGHGALAEVRLPVAGAERLAARGARLGQADQEGPAGESLHPAERAQAVFAVFARICRDTDAVTEQLDS